MKNEATCDAVAASQDEGVRDQHFMDFALAEGEKALENEEVPVGCVFVRRSTDEIMARGSNKTNETRNGTSHAEIVAINEAIYDKGVNPELFGDCDLYVTCEPCIMCAAALSRLGVQRVVFGCFNERFGGNGSILSIHEDAVDSKFDNYHAYSVLSGVCKEKAVDLFQRFYNTENRRAPLEKRKRKPANSER